jgi:hypothetical protein
MDGRELVAGDRARGVMDGNGEPAAHDAFRREARPKARRRHRRHATRPRGFMGGLRVIKRPSPFSVLGWGELFREPPLLRGSALASRLWHK